MPFIIYASHLFVTFNFDLFTKSFASYLHSYYIFVKLAIKLWLSKEDIIKAVDSDDSNDSNEKLKEILGSDSGSCINFLPYLKTQQQISNFFTKQVPEKQNSEQETSINGKKGIKTPQRLHPYFLSKLKKAKKKWFYK